MRFLSEYLKTSQLSIDNGSSKKELENIETMHTKTIEQLKKAEQELAFLSSKKLH